MARKADGIKSSLGPALAARGAPAEAEEAAIAELSGAYEGLAARAVLLAAERDAVAADLAKTVGAARAARRSAAASRKAEAEAERTASDQFGSDDDTGGSALPWMVLAAVLFASRLEEGETASD